MYITNGEMKDNENKRKKKSNFSPVNSVTKLYDFKEARNSYI